MFLFPLYTMMVFDDWKNDYPVAHIITSWSEQNDLSKWMDVINQKMQGSKLDWKPLHSLLMMLMWK